MRIELLVVPGCPNEEPAAAAIRRALVNLRLPDTPVHIRVVETAGEAEGKAFGGSPTILLDGVDPFAEPGVRPVLACRLYPTPAGLAGVPDDRMLRQAIGRAADQPT
ncbi:MAG TPA: hypothetical protein VFX70_15665 [Mycobacteriales bacterium]|nr:hypothetical protein [Mycobacteriales bacterium]